MVTGSPGWRIVAVDIHPHCPYHKNISVYPCRYRVLEVDMMFGSPRSAHMYSEEFEPCYSMHRPGLVGRFHLLTTLPLGLGNLQVRELIAEKALQQWH